MNEIALSQCRIGPGHPCFVIAEVGVNHNGDLEMARRLIDAAADARANAVKFQTFKAEMLVSHTASKAEYQTRAADGTESQFAMLKQLELTPEMHEALFAYCAERGILFLSTPFHEDDADYLARLGVPLFKVSSGDLTNLPFIEHLARIGRPVILSTGMSHLREVDEAVRTFQAAGGTGLALLQCVSDYPTAPAEANLRTLATLASQFCLPTGFSDHTLGTHIALAAVALGATILEKHLTLDRNLPGPDHMASLEPPELKRLVHEIRSVEAALGDGVKRPTPGESVNIRIGRKSLHWRRSLPANGEVTDSDVIALRPGDGLPPARFRALVGRKVARAVTAGAMVVEEDFLQ